MRSRRGLFSDDPVQNELRWEDCYSDADIAESYARLHPEERQKVREIEAAFRQFSEHFVRLDYQMRTQEFWGQHLLKRVIKLVLDMQEQLSQALGEEARRARSH
jgi:hypothetical protein